MQGYKAQPIKCRDTLLSKLFAEAKSSTNQMKKYKAQPIKCMDVKLSQSRGESLTVVTSIVSFLFIAQTFPSGIDPTPYHQENGED